ncbi:hypothetical protein BHE74_00041399 [Ensete ventricosum]|nr:hypothetical protein GW17_00009558 [Ensete ventricosum]RWW52206.1 hypothetical protein BHE74_00041399 [Ensete ventricosum]RZR78786.1 hypothetical protein BHM03_00004307 [Ensete ventricosum]
MAVDAPGDRLVHLSRHYFTHFQVIQCCVMPSQMTWSSGGIVCHLVWGRGAMLAFVYYVGYEALCRLRGSTLALT